MKTTELQIGDYALVKPSMMLIKIAAVHYKKVGYHAVTHKLNWVRMNLLEPIPLTPDILNANGFRYKESWSAWWHYSDGDIGSDFQIDCCEDGFALQDCANARIDYVHELQHALRLCRLNDLADNFKLEE